MKQIIAIYGSFPLVILKYYKYLCAQKYSIHEKNNQTNNCRYCRSLRILWEEQYRDREDERDQRHR